ncbi:tumor protein p53-inducible protein 11-like [Pollicipes pollicipes]|uniref:tumor protein p53-inducible protein 11-like n=1 Tax=Pollicipes pollicipes TaxID=41117 RepID=UPI0018850FC3|nr:tumor protein p53-inducible protein 11-like [Pollicipes pollicipes]
MAEAISAGAPAVEAVLAEPSTAALASSEPARPPMQTTVSRFVNAVPKLERKHSSGDLHSRLKTRKVLGVGATDNGDVHRSKISQVLGHNEHLYVRFPRGLLGWYLMLTCGLGLHGGLLVVSPAWAAQLQLLAVTQQDAPALALVSRGYGITLIGLSHLLYAVYATSDKVIIRSGLGVLILTDACAFGTQLTSIFQTGDWGRWSLVHLALRGLSAGVSLLYLNLSRNYYAGVRKSPTLAAAAATATAAADGVDARKKSL